MHISKLLIEAAKETRSVVNMVLLSSAGCDYAERHNQPRLREFIDLETLAMRVSRLLRTSPSGLFTLTGEVQCPFWRHRP
jgi:hypothetical protein